MVAILYYLGSNGKKEVCPYRVWTDFAKHVCSELGWMHGCDFVAVDEWLYSKTPRDWFKMTWQKLARLEGSCNEAVSLGWWVVSHLLPTVSTEGSVPDLHNSCENCLRLHPGATSSLKIVCICGFTPYLCLESFQTYSSRQTFLSLSN